MTKLLRELWSFLRDFWQDFWRYLSWPWRQRRREDDPEPTFAELFIIYPFASLYGIAMIIMFLGLIGFGLYVAWVVIENIILLIQYG